MNIQIGDYVLSQVGRGCGFSPGTVVDITENEVYISMEYKPDEIVKRKLYLVGQNLTEECRQFIESLLKI